MVADSHAFGPLLTRMTGDLDADDFSDLVQRMTLIYDVLVPPPVKRTAE